MSSAESLQEELQAWKSKYFELKESMAGHESDEDAFRSVLQRMLLRLCLSAEGQSSDFDDELTRIRSDVRQTDITVDDLAYRLNELDSALSAIDKLKTDNGKRYAKLIRDMCEQLDELKPPSANRKALKGLIKSLRKDSLKAQQYLPTLNEYARIQKDLMAWLQEQAPDKPSLMSRLFGSKSDTQAKPSSDSADSSETATSTQGDASFDIDPVGLGDDGDTAELAVISSQVRTALNNLLDQLTFPDNSQRALKALKDKISGPLNWTELGVTLDDLASIIISAVGRGQRDFGRFLSDIEERLDLIQQVMLGTAKASEKLRQEEQVLDSDVRSQISSMEASIEKETKLENLKNTIKSQVNNIYSALDRFSTATEEIHSAEDQDYATLKERFDALEKESAYFREQLKEERSKALHDSLTKLPNREAYDERFMLEYERWKRYKKPITMAVVDVDHFKSINDTYGHLSGDKVLQILAKELSERLRATDFVARYGGEEFVFLLPETDIEAAKVVMEKTRETISKLPFHFRDEKVKVTASFGLVQFREGLEPAQLFEAADKALYTAKNNGRNRIEIAD